MVINQVLEGDDPGIGDRKKENSNVKDQNERRKEVGRQSQILVMKRNSHEYFSFLKAKLPSH